MAPIFMVHLVLKDWMKLKQCHVTCRQLAEHRNGATSRRCQGDSGAGLGAAEAYSRAPGICAILLCLGA